MPAIISPQQYDGWLNPSIKDVSEIKGMIMTSTVPSLLTSFPVSTRVNKAAFDDDSCIKPI